MLRYHHLAARQYSLVTRAQLLKAGFFERQIDRLVAKKELLVVHRGVYVVAGAAGSFDQTVMAACLALDGYASHHCAAALWGLRRFERKVVEVVVARAHTPKLEGVVVRRSRHLDRLDRTSLGPIPITTRARTLLDLAGVASDRVEGALDGALLHRQVRLPALEQMLERAGARHPGRPLFERLVQDRHNGRRPTESVLEDDLLAVLRRYGLPEPVPQYEVGDHRIDFAYPEITLGIEADGLVGHAEKVDIQRNCDKGNDLVDWRILHFTWDDVHDRPGYVAARVAAELRRRAAA